MSWSLRTLKKINSSYLFMHANLINVNYIMKAFFFNYLLLVDFLKFVKLC